jgi:hypothetical protein
MTKTCLQCGANFEDVIHSGHEKKYCSSTCRNKAANMRREQKIENDIKLQYELLPKEAPQIEKIETTKEFSYNAPTYERYEHRPNAQFNGVESYSIGLLRENFKTETQLIEHRIRLENTLKDLSALEDDYSILEAEFEEFKKRPAIPNALSGVVDMVKTNPVETSKFVLELLSGIFDKFKKQT